MGARFQILLAALLFGTTGTAQTLASVNSPVAVGTMRIIVGGALLALIAVSMRALGGLRERPVLVLATGAGVAVYQVTFFAAVESTGVVVATIVAIGIGPVAAGAFEWAFVRIRPTRRWALATLLAAIGVVAISAGSEAGASVDAAGVVLALVAGAGYALYSVLAKMLLGRGCQPAGVAAAAFAVGALILCPALLVTDLGWLGSESGVILVLYLGVVPTVLAYLLFARALRRISAAEAATFTLAEPATATVLGAAILDERLTGGSITGIALVVLAMVVLAVPARRLRPAEVPA